MSKSKIQWTDVTWNPITGCTKISEGCKNCYAEKMHKRLDAMFSARCEGLHKYSNKFDKVVCHENLLNEPLKYKKPKKIFVCSMSDLFHKDARYSFVEKIMKTIEATPQHTYQILTKRSYRMYKYFDMYDIPENLWIGTTVENKFEMYKTNFLKEVKQARVKFISFEPLLEDVGKLDLSGIDWVIVGGETGSNARFMNKDWVVNIKNQCIEQGVPFFFKHFGSKYNVKQRCYIDDLMLWDIYRQFPIQKDTQ